MYKVKRFSNLHKDFTDEEFKDFVQYSCMDGIKNHPKIFASILGIIGFMTGALNSSKAAIIGTSLGLLSGYGIGKAGMNNVSKRINEYLAIYDKSNESVKRKMRIEYHSMPNSGYVGYIMSVILNGGLVTDKRTENLLDLILSNFPSEEFNKLNKFAIDVESLMKKSQMYDYDHMPVAWTLNKDEVLDWVDLANDNTLTLFSFGNMEDGSPVELSFDFKDKSWYMYPAVGSIMNLGSKIDYNKLKKEMIVYLERYIDDMKEYEDEDYVNWSNILMKFIKSYNFK